MNTFELLADIAQTRQLSFLVIGGHAVNAYGYSRITADLDILVDQRDRDAWLMALEGAGYQKFHDGATFLQLSPPRAGFFPIDIMLVAEDTFQGMREKSQVIEEQPTKPRIPDVKHMMALKLHALKHTRIHRFLKDFQDVVGLVECQKLDLSSEEMKRLFDNTVLWNCMNKFDGHLADSESDLDLEFPIAPDFVSKPPRLRWSHAYCLCEQMLASALRRRDFEERRLSQKIDVEFVL